MVIFRVYGKSFLLIIFIVYIDRRELFRVIKCVIIIYFVCLKKIFLIYGEKKDICGGLKNDKILLLIIEGKT